MRHNKILWMNWICNVKLKLAVKLDLRSICKSISNLCRQKIILPSLILRKTISPWYTKLRPIWNQNLMHSPELWCHITQKLRGPNLSTVKNICFCSVVARSDECHSCTGWSLSSTKVSWNCSVFCLWSCSNGIVLLIAEPQRLSECPIVSASF